MTKLVTSFSLDLLFYLPSAILFFVDILLSLTKFTVNIAWRHAVAQLVEALRYKSEGRGFDSRWCHWNFSLT